MNMANMKLCDRERHVPISMFDRVYPQNTRILRSTYGDSDVSRCVLRGSCRIVDIVVKHQSAEFDTFCFAIVNFQLNRYSSSSLHTRTTRVVRLFAVVELPGSFPLGKRITEYSK